MLYPSLSFRSRLWTPAEIPTAFWYDAQVFSSITIDTEKVSSWADLSGNNINVSQSNSSARPVYSESGLNGLPAINTTGGFLTTTSVNLSPKNIFAVALYTGSNPFSGFNGLITFNFTSYLDLISTEYTGVNWVAPGSAKKLNGNAASYVALPTIQSPFIINNNRAVNPNRSSFWVGTDRATARYWQGLIGEVFAPKNVLTTDEEDKAVGYLAHKWGLTANLPVGHPYKTAPPYK